MGEDNFDNTKKFLIKSLILIIVFSIISFSALGFFMEKKSHDAFHEIGDIYMDGMGEQISKHFETVVQLRFNQVAGIIRVVPNNSSLSKDELDAELKYRAEVRDFPYLALCNNDGDFETIFGDDIRPSNPEPFIESLNNGEKRVAVGEDSNGKRVVLFGLSAKYPMKDKTISTGLVAAVGIDYITDFLSLNSDEQMISYCIIRNDGSFVIDNSTIGFGDNTIRLPELLVPYEKNSYSLKAFYKALANNETYMARVNINGKEVKLTSNPLGNSEWNLISVMPINQINYIIEDLNHSRTASTILACSAILILVFVIFVKYIRMNNEQIKELQKSRIEATEASRAKSEFLANMSHDIRTPMNAIVGMTAIATAHIDDKESVKNCLRKIALSSKQLLGLINDVLDMSKIESGKMTLTLENTSLKELFEAAVSIIQPQINAKKQSFEVHIDNVVTENVWCDGVRLNQVLLNLLSNATKYTPEGGLITLSLYENKSILDDNFATFHIKVKDNGIGMSEEFLKKIYDSYSRVDDARVRKIEGTGLGMTITKYIVNAMNGAIDINSELGKGTEFHLVFNFEKAQDNVELFDTLPPWNMLVVDDDEFLCKTTIDTLNTFGIKADFTLSGEKAIEMVLERHKRGDDYQIILLDWKLPGKNGIQVAKELREYLGDKVPIILISAYDWSEFEDEAKEVGINGFIAKPLFKSTLFHNLRKYMIDDNVEVKETDISDKYQNVRILLAEDNDLNWEIANELLSEVGFKLEWAEDGQICYNKFKANPDNYDLILMDIRMPNMNGYEATKAIRALGTPKAKNIPIIAMSADAFSDDIQRCLDSGMNAHIAKPIDVSSVIKIIKKYI